MTQQQFGVVEKHSRQRLAGSPVFKTRDAADRFAAESIKQCDVVTLSERNVHNFTGFVLHKSAVAVLDVAAMFAGATGHNQRVEVETQRHGTILVDVSPSGLTTKA